MSVEERWQDQLARAITTGVWFGAGGAIAGLLWAGALRFGLGVGALWGGVSMAIAGMLVFLFYSVGLGKHGREVGAFMGMACLPPLAIAAVIGGIVWVVRSFL
jgi:hypothetical protein